MICIANIFIRLRIKQRRRLLASSNNKRLYLWQGIGLRLFVEPDFAKIYLFDMKDNEQSSSNRLDAPTALKQEIPSEFTSQYLQFYGLTLDKFNELKRETLQEVQKIVIVDQLRDFRSKLLIKMVSHSKDYEFIQLEVALGSFVFPRIDVLSQNKESLTHSLFYRREGGFGKVFRAHCFQQEIAIKCFSYTKLTFKKVLSDALSEYCFLKLASFLKVGPKLPSKTGYELIIYQDCIEFAMEYCQQIFFYTEIDQKGERQLKENLLKIHQINEIHLDIKPDNIRYSISYQRYVYIDFGFSRFIKEDLGFKTKTYFKGTLTYCSKEMKQLYQLSKEDYADLYYNDVIGLAAVLSNDQKKKTLPEDFQLQKQARKAKFADIEDITVHHLKYSIKYFIYQEEHQMAKNMLEDYKSILQRRNQSGKYKKIPIVTYENIMEQISDQKREDSDTSLFQSIINCLSCINQLSSLSLGRIDIWNEDKTYEMKIIKNEQGQAKKQQESYYHILSRVLKINSTKYTYSEKEGFAKIAANALDIFQAQIYQSREWKSCPEICYLSKLLLQYSLQSSQQSRSQIFINVIFNIFALQILSFDEIIQCFQQILTLGYNQNIKKKMTVALYGGFCLMFHLTDRFDSFQKCRIDIQEISMKFVLSIPQGIIKEVLHIIFSLGFAEMNPAIPSNTLQKYQERLFYEELQSFASHRLALAQYLKVFHQKQQYEKQVDKLFKQSIQKSLKNTSFQFQHYHFLWIIKCFEQDKHEECLRLTNFFYTIFQNKCIKSISLQVIDLNFNLQRTPNMAIKLFSQRLAQIKDKRYNRIIEANINMLIGKIISSRPLIFKQMNEEYQATILEWYVSTLRVVNIYQDNIERSIYQLSKVVMMAKRLKILYHKVYRQYITKKQLGQEINQVYITLKEYYGQLRQIVLSQKGTSLAFLMLVLASIHLLRQNSAIAKQIYKAICPVFARMKNLRYLHYQYFFLVFQLFTQEREAKQQIYINYVDLIDSNKQFDYLFKRKRTLGLVLSYFYENSSKKLPSFINAMARYLSIYNQQKYVETYIEVFMMHITYKSAISNERNDHFRTGSLGIIDRIEPISENPYNSLFFFHMISINFLKGNKSIFVQIFKAFRFMKTIAQTYICRTIYEKYFDMFHKEVPKKKAKKILYLVMINSPRTIKLQLFMRLFKQNQQKVTNSQQGSLQKHLRRLYDYQRHRQHIYEAQQQEILESRAKNFKAQVNNVIMRHLQALQSKH